MDEAREIMPRQQWLHTGKQVMVEIWNVGWNPAPAQAFHSQRPEKAACTGLPGQPSPGPGVDFSRYLSSPTWGFQELLPRTEDLFIVPLSGK